MSGLSVRTIQRIEKGANPDYESIMALSSVFELNFVLNDHTQPMLSRGSSLMNVKVIALFIGAFGLSVTLLGLLFTQLHWLGASFLLLLGITTLAIIFIPMLVSFWIRKIR